LLSGGARVGDLKAFASPGPGERKENLPTPILTQSPRVENISLHILLGLQKLKLMRTVQLENYPLKFLVGFLLP